MPDQPLAVAIAAAVVIGYVLGRLRPGRRLDAWADRQVRGPHGPRWWAAQAVMAAELAWVLTVHPRRSAANRRSWREEHRAPAPTFDSQWINERSDDQ